MMTRNSSKSEAQSDVVRCICSNKARFTRFIQCDHCLVWQHTRCMGFSKLDVPEIYFCELCSPSCHTYETHTTNRHFTLLPEEVKRFDLIKPESFTLPSSKDNNSKIKRKHKDSTYSNPEKKSACLLQTELPPPNTTKHTRAVSSPQPPREEFKPEDKELSKDSLPKKNARPGRPRKNLPKSVKPEANKTPKPLCDSPKSIETKPLPTVTTPILPSYSFTPHTEILPPLQAHLLNSRPQPHLCEEREFDSSIESPRIVPSEAIFSPHDIETVPIIRSRTVSSKLVKSDGIQRVATIQHYIERLQRQISDHPGGVTTFSQSTQIADHLLSLITEFKDRFGN